uniref:Uncharacterized protein n=1 Tax=Amphimedon queenslandica TaxID=400682 RepID=A0A1X7UFA7_AMPQE
HRTDEVSVVEVAKEFSLRNDKIYKTKVSDNNWWGLAPTVTGIGGATAPYPPSSATIGWNPT